MSINHAVVKAPGEVGLAAEWNQAHAGEIDNAMHGSRGSGLHADSHARQHSLQGLADHTSTATPGKHLQANPQGLPVDAFNTDDEIKAAVLASHTRLHAIDQALDHSGVLNLAQLPGLTTNKIWLGNGSNRPAEADLPAAGIAAGWEKIVDYVAPSDVTNIDVAGLDLDAVKSYMILFNTGNPTVSSAYVYLFVNGDYTVGNYYNEAITASGSSVSAVKENAPTISPTITTLTDCSLVAHMFRGPQLGKPAALVQGQGYPPATLVLALRSWAYNVAGNVTSLRLNSVIAGGFKAGSRLMIFKVTG